MKKISNITLLAIAAVFLILRVNFRYFPLSNIVILVLLAIVFHNSENKKSASMILALVIGILGLVAPFIISIFSSSATILNFIDNVIKIIENDSNDLAQYINNIKSMGNSIINLINYSIVGYLVGLIALGSTISIMTYAEASDKKKAKKQVVIFIVTASLTIVSSLLMLFGLSNLIFALTNCVTTNTENIFTTEFYLYITTAIILLSISVIPGIAQFIMLIINIITIKNCDTKVEIIE